MFQARTQPALPETVLEAEKANGFVHVCDQAALHFGSDRSEPTNMRPVVAVRPDGSRYVVLPCTSHDKTNFPDFFELSDKRVMWSRSRNGEKSYACSRYEVVAADHLKGKIGVMPQEARIELLVWLKSRY
jgi:hypothetical protein